MIASDSSTELHFEPPGPGSWKQDPVHFPRPMTRYFQETHPPAFKRGTNDFARITDFGTGDKLQLKGSAGEYLQGWINNLQGFSGTGIYHDTNGNGVIDSRDELIALVQNHGPLDSGSFVFV